jgi:cytochrome c peroxidase
MTKFMKSLFTATGGVLVIVSLTSIPRPGVRFAHRSPLAAAPHRAAAGDFASEAVGDWLASFGASPPVSPGARPLDVDTPGPPLGLPPIDWPPDNPYTKEKAELGKVLFFDKRLSSDGSVACASCHDPARAFTDGAPRSIGVGARSGHRNAPTLINHAYSDFQFWDGRAASLEEQVKGPLTNPLEMTSDPEPELALRHAVERLKAVPGYIERFREVFGRADFSIDDVAKAIATFERTLLSGNSPYDRFAAGDVNALTPDQVRGMAVFFERAACDRCHLEARFIDDRFYQHDERTIRGRRVQGNDGGGREILQLQGFNFTDGSYQNTGIGMDRPGSDLGRYLVTGEDKDKGAFKTPTLREIEHTAPYMHDGSLKTLEEVVEHYDKGGIENPRLNRDIKPLYLTAQEKQDLVAFLRSLSGEGWRQIEAPRDLPRSNVRGVDEGAHYGNDRRPDEFRERASRG